MNFVGAVAYNFCLALLVAFTQPVAHLLAEPCVLLEIRFSTEGAGQEELGAPQLPPRSPQEHPQKRQKVIEQKTFKFQI